MKEKIKEITKKYQKEGESIWWSKDLDMETKDKLTEELHIKHNIEIWKEAQREVLKSLKKLNQSRQYPNHLSQWDLEREWKKRNLNN